MTEKNLAPVLRLRCIRLVAIAAALAVLPVGARADFKVQMPDSEYGEFEIEPIGSYGMSGHAAFDDEQSLVQEFGYGVTPFWHTELEFETFRPPGPGNHLSFVQLTSENQIQFTERGEYWMDSGFFWEYGQVVQHGAPNETTFGPIFRKEIGRTINTVNLFIEKDIGGFASGRPVFTYAIESRVETGGIVEPGIQAYGTPGAFGHFAPLGQQDHRIGPQLFANLGPIGPGDLKMNGGILFGLTAGEPRRTLRLQAEYELHF